MKKFLSALLALVMVLSMIPMAASAAGYPVCIEDSAIRDFYNYAFSSTSNYNFAIDENGNENWTSPNLQTGYGSFTVKRGTPAYDFGCYRIKYQTTVYQPQEYKNIEIEYSTPGVVEVDTSGISSGYMELKFNYVSEGTTDITITYTVGKCWNTNNGPGYNEDYLNKTAKLVYNDVTSVYVPVDNDGDGIDDLDGTCLHEKDDEGYCLVDGCIHNSEMGLTCCPKHESEPEIVPPAGPDANKLWETNYMGGIYVYMTCEKNSSHAAKIPVKGHDEGLIMGEVLPNDGSDSDFPVDEYPWMCHVAPDAEYFLEVAAEDYDINQVKRWNFTHTATEVEGQTFYGDATGEYWFFSTSDGLYIDLTH